MSSETPVNIYQSTRYNPEELNLPLILKFHSQCTECRTKCLGKVLLSNTHSRYQHKSRGELSYLAPLGSENISARYFKQCFFRGGIIPQTESNTTPPSPKTEITNILFYMLNLWLRIYCSGLRGCDTREKEIVI